MLIIFYSNTSYTTFFGVTESTNTGVVTLETRECRQADCLNDVSSSATANLHELWYRDEGKRSHWVAVVKLFFRFFFNIHREFFFPQANH